MSHFSKSTADEQSFRKDVHRLRAVAVIAVFIYHLQTELELTPYFKAGYLGVDIFFVISGYVISKLLITSLEQNGKINFLEFYKRRILRILPATLFALTTVSIATAVVGTKTYADNMLEMTVAAILFIPNLYFLFSNTTYGSEDSVTPLLNLWSLGVEEQFYIFFPIFLLMVARWNLNISKTVFSIATLSLGAFCLLSLVAPNAAFYLSPMRAWEILFGTLVFLARRKVIKTHLFDLEKPYTITLILILAFANDLALGSVFLNLTVVFLTSVFLIFNKNTIRQDTTKFRNRLLLVNSVEYVGSISFSFYLFHYPIIQFLKINFFGYSAFSLFVMSLGATTVCAAFSYHVFEQKFRHSTKDFNRDIFHLFSMFLICITAAGFTTFLTTSKNNLASLDKNWRNAADINAHIESWHKFRWDNQPTKFSNKSQNTNILVVGDSHASDLYYTLNQSVLSTTSSLSYITPPRGPVQNNYRLECLLEHIQTNFKDRNCLRIDYGNSAVDIAKLYKNANIVVVASRYSQVNDKKLVELVQQLKLDDKKVALVSPAPEFNSNNINDNDLKKFIVGNRRLPNDEELKDLGNSVFRTFHQNDGVIRWKGFIKQLATQKKVLYIDQFEIRCDMQSKYCPLMDSGALLMSDYGHLTPEGTKFFSRFGQKEIEKIFVLSNYQ